jgi:hypothetical protein
MDRYDKYGYSIIISFFLILIIPALSKKLLHWSVFGLVSLNDLTLSIITLVVLGGLTWLFFFAPDVGNAKWKFRNLYKPKEDVDRIRDYIAEESKKGTSAGQIIHTLRRVGWPDELINNAYETVSKAKIITLKSKITRRKRALKR